MQSSRIEICGGIASGKTTCASVLSRIGLVGVYELFKLNPFWEAFYSQPARYAFETEISFTLQHYHQIKKQSLEANSLVCDFSFLLDVAYAKLGLYGSKLDAFKMVYDEIKKELLHPSLIIHLQCDPEVELSRIRTRGREVEKNITIDFLVALNEAVTDQVNLVKGDLPILTIDSSVHNFVDDETVKDNLGQLVSSYLF